MSDLDQRDPRLDEAYGRTPRETPPAELDDRIRAAARRAIGAGPQSLEARAEAARQRSWTARWRVPLSIAATVVLAVTLTLMVQDEERRTGDEASPHTRPFAPALEKAPPATPPADAQRADREAAPASAAPVAAPKRAASPPPREEPATAAKPAALEMRRQSLESAPAPVPATPAAAPAPAQSRPSAAPPAASAPEPPSGGLSDSMRRERALGERPARATRDAGATRSLEEWIEEIRRLKKEGREAEAAAELAELRRRHPDYVLPADLAR